MIGLRVLAAPVVAAVLLVVPVFAGEDVRRSINVTGNAQVMVVPDQVIVTFGVETWAADAVEAKRENDARLNDAIATIRKFGVEEKDIQTDYVRVEPEWDYRDGRRYLLRNSARRTVSVTLRDIKKFESLMTEVVRSGANMIEGVQFRTSELRKHRDQARLLAIRAAREKAQLLAGELNMKVGEPTNINEYSGRWWSTYSWWGGRSGGGMAQNVMQNAAPSGGGGDAVSENPVSPGQIAVEAEVQVTFEMEAAKRR